MSLGVQVASSADLLPEAAGLVRVCESKPETLTLKPFKLIQIARNPSTEPQRSHLDMAATQSSRVSAREGSVQGLGFRVQEQIGV